MEEKQINKYLRRQFTAIGWALVGYYCIMNILVMAAMFADVMEQYLRAFLSGNYTFAPDTQALEGNAWGYILTTLVGLVILNAWKGTDFWKTDILVKEKPMTAGTLLCVLCLCVGSQMVNSIWINLLEVVLNCFGLSVMNLLESVSGSSDTFSMFLYSAIFAPITEEIFFRGYILRSLRPYGKRFAIFTSAFLFGLFHGNLLQTPYAFLIGLVLGYVTGEYAIGWAMLLHLFNNLVVADLLTRLTANLSEMAVGVINLVIFGSFFIAAIAILITKRREIRDYNRGEWMDRRCLKCFFLSSGVIALTVIMVINIILMLFV